MDAPQPTQPPTPPPPRAAPTAGAEAAPKAEWRPGQTDEAPKPPSPHAAGRAGAAGSTGEAVAENPDFTESPTGTITVRTGVMALGVSAMLTSGGLLAIIAAAVVIAIGAVVISGDSTVDPADIAPPLEPLEPLEPDPAPEPEPEVDSDGPEPAGPDKTEGSRPEARPEAGVPTRSASDSRPPPRSTRERAPERRRPAADDDLFGDEPPPSEAIELGDGGGDEITFEDLTLPPDEMLDPPGTILVDNQKGEVEFRAPGERYGVGEPIPPGRYDIYANFGKDLLVRAGSVQVGSGETITLKCKSGKKTCAP